MIFRKTKLVIFVVILLVGLFSIKVLAEEKDNYLLIIYDQRYIFGENIDIVTTIEELAGHFAVKSTELSQDKYSTGLVEQYDYIIVIGNRGKFNDILLHDLAGYSKNIFWIGKGFDKLVNYANLPITYKGISYNLVKIMATEGSDEDQHPVYTIPAELRFELYQVQDAKIYANLSDGVHIYPYIFRKDNFFYISRFIPFDYPFYIFADVLHDFFNAADHGNNKKIYIRIEDVHPFRDPEKLRKIGELLYKNNIPFLISLIPTYINEQGQITPMSEVKGFAETIRYLQKLGGTVVLHGYTHQHYKHFVSGEGFEFWDSKNNSPLDINMKEYLADRITRGIIECVKNGVYPLAFEAPHYAMSQEGYRILKEYFSTYNGDLQTSDYKFNTVTIPYKIQNTKLFNKLISGTIGYINPDDKMPIYRIMENYKKISYVRDALIGVYYHPFLDIKYLQELIEGFKKLNLQFYDLRQEYNWVKCGDINIKSIDGKFVVNTGDIVQKTKVSFPYLNYFIILIVSFIIIMLVIFYIFNKKNNERLLGGEEGNF